MIIFGLIQFALIAALTFYEYRNKSPIVFMWATLLVMFGVMHVVSYTFQDYQYVDTLDEASWFAILFCLVYFPFRFFTRWFLKKKKSVVSVRKKTEDRMILLGKLVILFSILIYAYYIFRTGGSFFLAGKSAVYQTMAEGNVFFLLSTYLYYSFASLFLYCLIKGRKKDAITIGILIAVRSLLSSSRMDMIVLFSGAIAYYILKAKKYSIKTVIILSVVGVFALFAVYALRVFRYYYGFSGISRINLPEFMEHLADFVKNDDGELGLRKIFYYFIENKNDFDGFGTGAGYRRVLLFAIPGRLAGSLKPEDMCIVMGRAWKPGNSGIIALSITPTLFGDCYANFGFWGCLMGAFWAVFGTLMDAVANRKNELIRVLLWGLMSIEFIVIGRGTVYNPIVQIWYCSLMIGAFYWVGRVNLGGKMMRAPVGKRLCR